MSRRTDRWPDPRRGPRPSCSMRSRCGFPRPNRRLPALARSPLPGRTTDGAPDRVRFRRWPAQFPACADRPAHHPSRVSHSSRVSPSRFLLLPVRRVFESSSTVTVVTASAPPSIGIGDPAPCLGVRDLGGRGENSLAPGGEVGRGVGVAVDDRHDSDGGTGVFQRERAATPLPQKSLTGLFGPRPIRSAS